MTVPENWQTPGDQEVTISYAILKSPSLSPFPDPVVYLEGGPGASALAGLPMLQRTFADLRRYRDIILYDQRGTAFSSPPLQLTTTSAWWAACPRLVYPACRVPNMTEGKN